MAAKKSTAKKSTSKKSSPKKASTRKSPTSKSSATAGLDKSIETFRSSLERSLSLSRERLQEVVDDAVSRGRMQRRDAEKMVSDLVSRGRKQTDTLLKDLERLAKQAQDDARARAKPVRKRATRAARQARRQVEGSARVVRDAADRPLAEADRLRRRTGVSAGFPITAYDQLTAAQVKARLRDLTPAELRKVRTYEKRNAARKGVLSAIEKKLS